MLTTHANTLLGLLTFSGAMTTQELIEQTSLSQPTVSRALESVRAAYPDRFVLFRMGRQIYYGVKRPIHGCGLDVPLHEINASGHASPLGHLSALSGGEFVFFTATGEVRLSDGLPWFLQDSRPQGYLGKLFGRDCVQFGLPEDVSTWTDDQVVYALTMAWRDSPGNIVVGFKVRTGDMAQLIKNPTSESYEQLAANSLRDGIPFSSVGGEQPKFSVCYLDDANRYHRALVKFSPPLQSVAAERSRDLLVAEHVANEVLLNHGIEAARTAITHRDVRCYLESERFDRIGLYGQLGLVSMGSINNEFIGKSGSWTSTAKALSALGMITPECLTEIDTIETFGRLIGNTDMHQGNLSFYFDDITANTPSLRLAPVYDMLPMLYALQHGEIVAREFNPPETQNEKAINMAKTYWQELALRDDISESFRDICQANTLILNNRFEIAAPVA